MSSREGSTGHERQLEPPPEERSTRDKQTCLKASKTRRTSRAPWLDTSIPPRLHACRVSPALHTSRAPELHTPLRPRPHAYIAPAARLPSSRASFLYVFTHA